MVGLSRRYPRLTSGSTFGSDFIYLHIFLPLPHPTYFESGMAQRIGRCWRKDEGVQAVLYSVCYIGTIHRKEAPTGIFGG